MPAALSEGHTGGHRGGSEAKYRQRATNYCRHTPQSCSFHRSLWNTTQIHRDWISCTGVCVRCILRWRTLLGLVDLWHHQTFVFLTPLRDIRPSVFPFFLFCLFSALICCSIVGVSWVIISTYTHTHTKLRVLREIFWAGRAGRTRDREVLTLHCGGDGRGHQRPAV